MIASDALPRVIFDRGPDGRETLDLAVEAGRIRAIADRIGGAIKPGDTVVLFGPSGPDLVRAWYGTVLAGATPLILPHRDEMPRPGPFRGLVARSLRQVRAPLAIGPEDIAEDLPQQAALLTYADLGSVAPVEGAEFQIALPDIWVTTPPMRGRPPEAHLMDGDTLAQRLDAVTRGLGVQTADDRVCVARALSDLGGAIYALALPLVTGADVVLFDPQQAETAPGQLAKALARNDATFALLTGRTFSALAREEDLPDLTGVRRWICTDDRAQAPALRTFCKRLDVSEAALAVSLELADCGGPVTLAPRLTMHELESGPLASFGQPLPGCELTVSSEGEVLVMRDGAAAPVASGLLGQIIGDDLVLTGRKDPAPGEGEGGALRPPIGRPQGEVGERSARGERPPRRESERPPGSERPPRPEGERPARGERPPRGEGERPARGERPPRGEGGPGGRPPLPNWPERDDIPDIARRATAGEIGAMSREDAAQLVAECVTRALDEGNDTRETAIAAVRYVIYRRRNTLALGLIEAMPDFLREQRPILMLKLKVLAMGDPEVYEAFLAELRDRFGEVRPIRQAAPVDKRLGPDELRGFFATGEIPDGPLVDVLKAIDPDFVDKSHNDGRIKRLYELRDPSEDPEDFARRTQWGAAATRFINALRRLKVIGGDRDWRKISHLSEEAWELFEHPDLSAMKACAESGQSIVIVSAHNSTNVTLPAEPYAELGLPVVRITNFGQATPHSGLLEAYVVQGDEGPAQFLKLAKRIRKQQIVVVIFPDGAKSDEPTVLNVAGRDVPIGPGAETLAWSGKSTVFWISTYWTGEGFETRVIKGPDAKAAESRDAFARDFQQFYADRLTEIVTGPPEDIGTGGGFIPLIARRPGDDSVPGKEVKG